MLLDLSKSRRDESRLVRPSLPCRRLSLPFFPPYPIPTRPTACHCGDCHRTLTACVFSLLKTRSSFFPTTSFSSSSSSSLLSSFTLSLRRCPRGVLANHLDTLDLAVSCLISSSSSSSSSPHPAHKGLHSTTHCHDEGSLSHCLICSRHGRIFSLRFFSTTWPALANFVPFETLNMPIRLGKSSWRGGGSFDPGQLHSSHSGTC